MRNTIISTACIALALVLAASCNIIEENVPSVENSGRTVITAVASPIGAETKVEMAYCYEARWQAGDRIHVRQGSTTDTFTLVGGEGTTKGTFEGTKSITGEIEAFYPVSVGESMTWPAIQTNDQAAPMYANQDIAGAEGETVSFSSLGAMLQIVFNSTVENVTLKSIELIDGGKDMSGAFSVDENGKAVISTNTGAGVTLDLGAGKALGRGANFFYLSIPAGKYNDLTISFRTTDKRVCTMHSTTMPEVMHNTVCRLTLTGTSFEKDPVLPGKFSVGDGRIVRFSQGNMYWDGDSFEFETNQYDYPVGWNASHISHFFWSNKASVAIAQSYRDPDPGEHDVIFTNGTETGAGKDFTVCGITGRFRTLSALEWAYLLEHHNKMAASVCDIDGLVIAPDDYNGTLKQSYTVDQWDAAESEGIVFLPSAGHRFGLTFFSQAINGSYWSSAPWTFAHAQYMEFANDDPYYISDLIREGGLSLRLVEDTNSVSSLTLDKTELNLAIQETAQLTVTVSPDYTPDKTVIWSSDTPAVATVSDGMVHAVAAGTAWITATSADGLKTASCTVTVEPLLPGEFSVGGGKVVRFSPGNMYWDGNSFEFEARQYDFPTAWNTSHISLFCWSSKASVAITQSGYDPDPDEHDVIFTNTTETSASSGFTVCGYTGRFRTLSALEWEYLIDNHSISMTSINGICGLAIAPDAFKDTLQSSYTTEQWETAESMGVVFLPCAGDRYGSAYSVEFTDGYYWSSAPWNNDHAQYLTFDIGYGYIRIRDFLRESGFCIRLVEDME